MQDIEKNAIKGKVILGDFCHDDGIDKMPLCVNAPFGGWSANGAIPSKNFIIDEPYTERFFFATHKIFDQYTFPNLQLIHNKKRLIKLLWFPYSDMLKEQLIKTQSEFYECYDENQNFICYPLRIDKDTKMTDEYHPTIKRLDLAKIPTFEVHEEIYNQIRLSLEYNCYVNPLIHYFIYLDHNGEKLIYKYVIQFLI